MIKVFYFVAIMNHWQDVVKEQMEVLRNSGLHDEMDMMYVCMSSPKRSAEANILRKLLPTKAQLCYFSSVDQFEFPALHMVKQYTKPEDRVFYWHTKGVSRTEHSSKIAGDKWREYMNWGCIERYREHLNALDSFDISGVQLTTLNANFAQKCGAKSVYAGNFWWANGEYIEKLTAPEIVSNRWLAEGWLFKASPKAFDLHNLTNGALITTKNTFALPEFNRSVYDKDYEYNLVKKPVKKPVKKSNNVIYTVLIGEYETLKPAPRYTGWDTVAFVDDVSIENNGWTLVELPIDKKLGAVRTSRLPRILPHKYVSEYDESLYIDASVFLKQNPSSFCVNALWSSARHWERDNVWQEFEANIVADKVHHDTCRAQERDYISRNLKEKHIPLFQNGVIYRKHNNQTVIETCEAWWKEFCKYTCRDQLSLAMALATTGLNVTEMLPRPKKSCDNLKWKIIHNGNHKKIYNKMPLYFLIPNLRGSSISRGIQVGKGLYDRGVRNKVVNFSCIPNIKNSTVVVVKELSHKNIDILKANGNKIIYDIVDNENVWKNGLGQSKNKIDAIIFPNENLYNEWKRTGKTDNKQTAIIEHHGDYRFTDNTATSLNAICISTGTQIPNEVFECNIDCITEENGWENLFEEAKSYNLHVGIYKDKNSGKNKPATKLVTAAACNANMILERTPSHLKLMPEYPYYVNDASELPAMYERCKRDYKTQKWNDALDMIKDVRNKTTLDCIACQYEEFMGRLK